MHTHDARDGQTQATPMEMWGGIECTVNRVGPRYFDQVERSGHASRSEDLDAIAALGIRRLRYPFLWERTAPERLGAYNWRWSDERMVRMRRLGIRPIATLLHHGSGPHDTALVDPEFPEKFAQYAGAVAERYPDIIDYTPVNEPLTTARFSGLYGLWYPHGRDDRTFARALVAQCRATVLAMDAIRVVRPDARLIQTEDLGRIYCTPAMTQRAQFFRRRRWLSLDLLSGRVTPRHPLHGNLLSWGVRPRELEFFVERARPPDIIGVNHYLTSDRFFDERARRYPGQSEAARRVGFADVEAVRADPDCPVDVGGILHEVWARYGVPVAVTEAHLGGTREEQLRWLYETWENAAKARASGVDVRSVTAWSLFGAFDWNSLVTRNSGFYESGVFDVRGPRPRPTALARLVRKLATTGRAEDEPLVRDPGWWRRPERLFHAMPVGRTNTMTPDGGAEGVTGTGAPLLVCPGPGPLTRELLHLMDVRGISRRVVSRDEVPFLEAWAVVDLEGSDTLSAACAKRGLPLLMLSVDGEPSSPSSYPGALVVRGVDASAPQLIHVALDLLVDGEQGTWRVAHISGVPFPEQVGP